MPAKPRATMVIRKVIGTIFPRFSDSRPQHGSTGSRHGLMAPYEAVERAFTLGPMSPGTDESRYFMGPDDMVPSVSFRFK